VERVDKLSPEKPITAAKCNRWVSRSLSSGAHSRDPLAPPTLLADPDHRRIPQYLSNGSALPLPLWERVGVRSCSVPANHNLSPGLHRYPAIPLALALWLLNSLPGLGDIKHANSGNRGARRRVGRLRVECSGHCAGIYISPVMYQQYTCAQLAQEAQGVSQRAAALSGVQDQKRTNDGLATAAAVVIFWPAAFFVGGDKQTAAELAQMKGQMVAIEQASIQKKCGIQFQGKPPGA